MATHHYGDINSNKENIKNRNIKLPKLCLKWKQTASIKGRVWYSFLDAVSKCVIIDSLKKKKGFVQLGPRSKQSPSLNVLTKDEH